MEPDGYFVTFAGGRRIEIVYSGNNLKVNGDSADADLAHITGSTYSLLLDGISYEIVLAADTVYVNGQPVHVDVKNARAQLIDRYCTTSEASTAATTTLNAPMPGLVLQVAVQPGETVECGQGLLVLEAMKMENELRAPCSGVVTRVCVKVGDAVAKQALLIEVMPLDPEVGVNKS